MRSFFLLITAFFVVSFPTRLLASDSLLFQQAGPRNWAINDFEIIVGYISDTTRETIYVTPVTYANIASFVSNIGSRTAKPDEQVFSVTEIVGARPKAVFFIPDRAVGDIMRKIVMMCQVDRQTVPAFVSEIADSFPHKK